MSAVTWTLGKAWGLTKRTLGFSWKHKGKLLLTSGLFLTPALATAAVHNIPNLSGTFEKVVSPAIAAAAPVIGEAISEGYTEILPDALLKTFQFVAGLGLMVGEKGLDVSVDYLFGNEAPALGLDS